MASAVPAWLARLERVLGGPARTRVVLLLAAVLGLNSADVGTIGAVAAPLQVELGISQTRLGLFVTVSAGVGALAAPAAGVLADRIARVPLLAGSIVVWGAAMLRAATAQVRAGGGRARQHRRDNDEPRQDDVAQAAVIGGGSSRSPIGYCTPTRPHCPGGTRHGTSLAFRPSAR